MIIKNAPGQVQIKFFPFIFLPFLLNSKFSPCIRLIYHKVTKIRSTQIKREIFYKTFCDFYSFESLWFAGFVDFRNKENEAMERRIW